MGHNSHTRHNHPVIQFIHAQQKTAEKIDYRWTQIELGRDGLQAVIGGRAFRSYDALSQSVGLNKAGNLRGMVLSSKWRTLFRYSSDAGEYMETIGYLATLVSGIAESAPRIDAIAVSSDSPAVKGLQIAGIAGTIAQRTLLGAIPAGTHLIYRSLEGWCMIAGLAGPKAQSAASQCISTLNYADTLVQTAFQTVTDTSNESRAVWSVIDFVTSRRKKRSY